MTFYNEYTQNKEVNAVMYLAVTGTRLLPIGYYLVEFLIYVYGEKFETFDISTLAFLVVTILWILLSTKQSKWNFFLLSSLDSVEVLYSSSFSTFSPFSTTRVQHSEHNGYFLP
jgi:hypothetical protein